MPWVVQRHGDGCDSLMKDAKMCMMIRGAAGHLWLTKIWCVLLKRRLERTDDSPLRHFPCIFLKFHGHFFTKLCLINIIFGNCVHAGCRSRYHVLCIAGDIVLRWTDTKTAAPLWQVPQQWWKLCRKVVYGMYIKGQYKWFVMYSCFFLIAHRNLLSGKHSYYLFILGIIWNTQNKWTNCSVLLVKYDGTYSYHGTLKYYANFCLSALYILAPQTPISYEGVLISP